MNDTTLIPDIFLTLMAQADKIEELDEETMSQYYELLNDAPSFMPELVAIVGPEVFEILVKNYGGRSMQIPTADQIISLVRKNGQPEE